MGVSKSITIEGVTFQFEVKSKDGVMHVSLYSGEGEAAHAIMSAEEVVDALDMVRGWVKPRENRPFTEQELKFLGYDRDVRILSSPIRDGEFRRKIRQRGEAHAGFGASERDGGAVCRDMLLRRQLVQDAFGAAAGGVRGGGRNIQCCRIHGTALLLRPEKKVRYLQQKQQRL